MRSLFEGSRDLLNGAFNTDPLEHFNFSINQPLAVIAVAGAAAGADPLAYGLGVGSFTAGAGCFRLAKGAQTVACLSDGGVNGFWGSEGTFLVGGPTRVDMPGPLFLYRPDTDGLKSVSLGDFEGGGFVLSPMLRISGDRLLIGGSSGGHASVVRVADLSGSPRLDPTYSVRVPLKVPGVRAQVIALAHATEQGRILVGSFEGTAQITATFATIPAE